MVHIFREKNFQQSLACPFHSSRVPCWPNANRDHHFGGFEQKIGRQPPVSNKSGVKTGYGTFSIRKLPFFDGFGPQMDVFESETVFFLQPMYIYIKSMCYLAHYHTQQVPHPSGKQLVYNQDNWTIIYSVSWGLCLRSETGTFAMACLFSRS